MIGVIEAAPEYTVTPGLVTIETGIDVDRVEDCALTFVCRAPHRIFELGLHEKGLPAPNIVQCDLELHVLHVVICIGHHSLQRVAHLIWRKLPDLG